MATLRQVHWYGAHYEEVSISMDVYRQRLQEQVRVDDPYSLKVWPPGPLPVDRAKRRLPRALGKYVGYPWRIWRESGKASLVHFLDHSSGHLLPRVREGARTVVTLHDLIPLQESGGLSPRQLERFRSVVDNLRRADRVVAVSEYSRQEAIALLNLREEKVVVVPNGVTVPELLPEHCELCDRLRKAGATRIALSVGSSLERKNLALLPGLMAEARRVSGKEWALLRVGSPMPEELRRTLFAELGEDRLLEAGRVEDETLSAAYTAADVVVIPSLREGFGLPVLEGFAHGTPVACSDATSLPEVAGGLGSLFDPGDEKEAGRRLVEAAHRGGEEGFRRELRERAKEFSWRRTLEGFYAVYGELLGED
ncbi:glycosyltransferase family 4 protein [Roseibacillus ishigakijimensis]|uniref:Glycosyltransferase family 4 protein n=1 Tax=Roseibacillus ishigakijimensis TaxID=454146 RepID=A0A934RPX3_9BACT|nr:glycosyltransferase family 1 protein [Roseibacillus ishigakijimensis]MBK1833426.1 glycosyltransferase family 4 protein [Roseibacillus ishigakijimensis]